MQEKKILPKTKGITVVSNDQGGDLSKPWYVRWRQDGKAQKKYGKLAHIDNLEERRVALEELHRYWQERVGERPAPIKVIAEMRAYLLKQKVEKPLRHKAWQTNDSRLTVLADFAKGREITQELLAAFFLRVRATKHPVTYNNYVNRLSGYLRGIGRADLIPDKLAKIAKAKKKSQPGKWLQKHELNLLHKYIEERNPWLWFAIRIMFNCAIRPGELRMLKAKHFLLDLKVVHIPPEISKVGVERFARISEVLLPDLAMLLTWEPERYLFPSLLDEKKPAGKNQFTRKIRAYMDELGFGPEYSPCYSFRHTAAMQSIRDGADVREISQWMGHASYDETMGYLRQLSYNDLDGFAKKFKGL